MKKDLVQRASRLGNQNGSACHYPLCSSPNSMRTGAPLFRTPVYVSLHLAIDTGECWASQRRAPTFPAKDPLYQDWKQGELAQLLSIFVGSCPTSWTAAHLWKLLSGRESPPFCLIVIDQKSISCKPSKDQNQMVPGPVFVSRVQFEWHCFSS